MEKLQPSSYPNMLKWSLYLLSPSGKNAITFCNIWDIFTRKQGEVKSQMGRIKIWQILFHPHDSWSTSCKKTLVQICGYRSQRTFLKNCNPKVQIWLSFLLPFQHFLKSWVKLIDAENRLAPISNPKNEKPKSSYPLFHFQTNLIK